MARLEAQGFLHQPHASAGRVPTTKAYEFYARQVAERARLSRADRNWINARLLSQRGKVEELLPRASHVLAELAQGLGIVVSLPVTCEPLEQVRFLQMEGNRVLVILLTKTGQVQDVLLRLPKPFTPEELECTARYLNENFPGWALASIPAELERRAARDRSRYERLARRAALLCRESLAGIREGAAVYVEGTPHLIEQAEEAGRDELRELLQTIEQKEKLVHLLRATVEQVETNVHIRIGLQQLSPAIQHYALISASYGAGAGPLGSLAILGPTRMDYPRVITAVTYVARLFDRVLHEN
jgi:heat-inducible transcriptional repressor